MWYDIMNYFTFVFFFAYFDVGNILKCLNETGKKFIGVVLKRNALERKDLQKL